PGRGHRAALVRRRGSVAARALILAGRLHLLVPPHRGEKEVRQLLVCLVDERPRSAGLVEEGLPLLLGRVEEPAALALGLVEQRLDPCRTVLLGLLADVLRLLARRPQVLLGRPACFLANRRRLLPRGDERLA